MFMYLFIHTYMYIYIYIYVYMNTYTGIILYYTMLLLINMSGESLTTNIRTNTIDVRGFGSRIILPSRGVIPRPLGNLP